MKLTRKNFGWASRDPEVRKAMSDANAVHREHYPRLPRVTVTNALCYPIILDGHFGRVRRLIWKRFRERSANQSRKHSRK